MLVYDGDCGFCTAAARWISRRVPPSVAVEPWQRLDLGPLGLTDAQVASAAWWVEPGSSPLRGHEAISRALGAAGGFYPAAGWLILRRPVSWLAALVYWLIARYRYRLPGGTGACRWDRPPH